MDFSKKRVPNTKYISLNDFENNLKNMSKSMIYHLRVNRTYYNILLPEGGSEEKYQFLQNYLKYFKQNPHLWLHDVEDKSDYPLFRPKKLFIKISGNYTKSDLKELREKLNWWDTHLDLVSPEINLEEFRDTVRYIENYFQNGVNYSKKYPQRKSKSSTKVVEIPTKLRELPENLFLEFESKVLNWVNNSERIPATINLPQMVANLICQYKQRRLEPQQFLYDFLISNPQKIEEKSIPKQNNSESFDDHDLVMREYLKNQKIYDSGEVIFSKVNFQIMNA
jgi:hypothetical protein